MLSGEGEMSLYKESGKKIKEHLTLKKKKYSCNTSDGFCVSGIQSDLDTQSCLGISVKTGQMSAGAPVCGGLAGAGGFTSRVTHSHSWR